MRNQSFYSLYIEVKSNYLSFSFIGFSQLQNEIHFVNQTAPPSHLPPVLQMRCVYGDSPSPVLCTLPSDSCQAGLMVEGMSVLHRKRARALLFFLCPTDLYHCYLKFIINTLTTSSGQITSSRTPTSRPRPQESHVHSWTFLFAKRATRNNC